MTESATPRRLRLPAYGRAFLQARREGRHGISGFCHVVIDDRSLRADWPARLVLQADVSPDMVDWGTLLVGLDVHVVYRDGNHRRADQVAQLIADAGCRGLVIIGHDHQGDVVELEIRRSAMPTGAP